MTRLVLKSFGWLRDDYVEVEWMPEDCGGLGAVVVWSLAVSESWSPCMLGTPMGVEVLSLRRDDPPH